MNGGMGMQRGRSHWAADWYVDSVNGNDANTGTSAAQAFASINRLTNFNYFANSEDWTQQGVGGASVARPAAAPPPGVGAAQFLTEGTNNGQHWVRPLGTFPVTIPGAVFSCYVKAATRTKVQLSMDWGAGYGFDLSVGTAVTINNNAAGWGIQAAGSGWYRIWITMGALVGTLAFYLKLEDANGNVSYQGDGASGVYVAGAQCNSVAPGTNLATATPYPYLKTGAAPGGALIAHQKLGLACNSAWREEFAGNPDGIEVQAYGSGAKPMLDCSDAVAQYLWNKTAGYTNVYEADSMPIDVAANKTFVSVWEDGTRLMLASSIANCDATAGSYYPSSTASSPVTIYVHTLAGDNPASHLMEYSRRQHGYADGGPNCSVNGIWTRRNLHNDGSLIVTGSAVNCLAGEGSVHNVYLGPSAQLVNVEAAEAYQPGGSGASTLFILNSDTATGNEVVALTGCYGHRRSMAAGDAQTYVGFYCHTNVSGSYGTVQLVNCRFDGALGSGIGGTNLNNLVVSGGESTGCLTAIAPGAVNSTISGFTAAAVQYGVQTQTGAVATTVSNCNFTVTGGYSAAGVFVGSNASAITLTGTSISGAGVFAIYDQAAGTAITATQNAISTTGYFWYLPDTTAALTSDFNTFTSQAGTVMNYRGTGYTLAAYKAATGQDGHSTP